MRRSLIVAVTDLPTCWDMEHPAGFRHELGADLFQNCYEQLTSPTCQIGEDGVRRSDWQRLRPDLAEAWWWSDDRRTWTFRLRRGVCSAAGHELSAEDVRWGWERAFALRDIGKWVALVSSVPDAAAIEVLDRFTIAFHLDAPNSALPRTLAQCTPAVYDSAVARAAASPDDPWASRFLARTPAGFGPYTLASHSEEAVVLRAVSHWWRGPLAIEEAVFQRFPSRAEAIAALQGGAAHLLLGVSGEEAADLRQQPHLRVVVAETPPGLALHLDPTEPPLENVLVRRAIAHALPYREIIATAFLGAARRWKSWLQPENPAYAPDLWPYEEDLAEARRLLAAAGCSGFATRLAVLPGDGALLAAQLIADALARLDISVTIEEVSGQSRRDLVGLAKANLAPLMLRAGAGRGHRVYDPIYTLMHDFGPGRMRLVRYAYDGQELATALRAIAAAGDDWEREARRAQAILNADAVVIPLCWSHFYVAYHRDLTGYRWYPDNRIRLADLAWR
ncbi:MAG: hypothetical protein KatS3mg061_0476 [Dehalococcoidia bacterium]|nr:MAG: hypothetical protein KatS3mg061_0476 [Dehalococcoidia bacterium]